MGVCCSVSGIVPRGRCAADAQFPGGVQRAALAGEDGGALADDAQRSAAVAGGVPADATLDTSRMLRDHGGGSAFAAARVRGAQAAAHGDGGGQPDAAVHAGVGARAGYDGAKRRKGSKVHAAVDTLGNLLALHVTAANEQDRAQVEKVAEEVQRITGGQVELGYVDQGYTGEAAESAAPRHGIHLEVVKHTEAKRGFVLLPRRL